MVTLFKELKETKKLSDAFLRSFCSMVKPIERPTNDLESGDESQDQDDSKLEKI